MIERISPITSRRRSFQEAKREAFDRMVERMCNDETPLQDVPDETRMKMLYYTINLVSMDRQDDYKGDPRYLLQLHDMICDLLEEMPTETFKRWFPIEKKYDGDRTGTKDYFYTHDYLCGKERIENPMELLMEYQNWTVTFYVLNILGAIDDLCRRTGQETI